MPPPTEPSSPAPTAAATPTPHPDRAPAHTLWVELATRITTQRLHYRSGDEETAVKSVLDLFRKTRELMDKNPDAAIFLDLAEHMLNETIRPFTARWHGWMVPDPGVKGDDGRPVAKFRDPQVRRLFRGELRQLQPRLLGYQRAFNRLRAPETPLDPAALAQELKALVAPNDALLAELTQQCQNTLTACLGADLPLQAGEQVKVTGSIQMADIVKAEQQVLLQRRTDLGLHHKKDSPRQVTNASGLALSGGGIRSATFCLGIVQVLQRRGLLPQFDYLSTVSGGGYLGTFLSTALGTVPDDEGAGKNTAKTALPARSEDDVPTTQVPPPGAAAAAAGTNKTTTPAIATTAATTTAASALTTAAAGAGTPAMAAPAAVGAATASATAALATKRFQEVFERQNGIESGLLRHLRNNSKYLIDGGLVRQLQIPTLIISGIFWNLAMLLPVVLIAVLVAYVFQAFLWGADVQSSPGVEWDWRGGFIPQAAKWLGLGLVGCWALQPVLKMISHGRDPRSRAMLWRAGLESLTPIVGVLALVFLLLMGLPHLLFAYEKLRLALNDGRVAQWLNAWLGAEKGGADIVAISGGGLLTTVLGLLAARIKPNWPTLRKFAVNLFILSGPVLLLLIFIIVGNRLGLGRAWKEEVVKVEAFGVTSPPLPESASSQRLREFTEVVKSTMFGVPVNVSVRRSLPESPQGMWSPWVVFFITVGLTAWAWLFVNINTLALHTFYRDKLCGCYMARRLGEAETEKEAEAEAAARAKATLEGKAEPQPTPPPLPWLERLARWLSGESVHGRTQVLKRVRLEKLNKHPAAPFHLINMTVNVPVSSNPELRGRASDFFLTTRLYCGSPLTGYKTTAEVVEIDPHFDLGTAMAVSGAAASTSMGWKSLPNFRFLMTLFNVRLGYWLRWVREPQPAAPPPDELSLKVRQLRQKARQALDGVLYGRLGPPPARVPAAPSALASVFHKPGPWYLFREAFAWMNESNRYLNLSDGGHIENLAVYELLRRQTKFIVCVDGGQEPGMECTDLIRLQRYAEIDLGIRMSYDLLDLALLPEKHTRAYGLLVKIDYDPAAAENPQRDPATAKLGWMLYLKLAMTGTEPAYVLDYRRENPVFPHETTGDQIFEEAQFEAYRNLGECAMESFFRDELLDPPVTITAATRGAGAGASAGAEPGEVQTALPPQERHPATLRDWFQSLANHLLPDNDPAVISIPPSPHGQEQEAGGK